MKINLQGAVTPPVPLGRGGKQGSSDNPALWIYLLDYVLGPVVREWLSKCFGFHLDDEGDPLSHAIWADDIFWFS
eukprot:4613054-Heterocapsa_arctica.AAC.1